MQIRFIDILKGVLPILVVLIHCNFSHNAISWADSLNGFEIFLTIFSTSLLSLAVPSYFFISGYLFFLKTPALSFGDYRNKMRRRIKTLLLPYIAWNLIGLALLLLKKTPILSHYFPAYDDFNFSIGQILSGFWGLDASSYPYDMTLWFVRNLIIVQIFAYFIGLALKHWGAFTILPVAAAIVALETFLPGIDKYGLASSFFFFILGGIASHHLKRTLLSTRHLAIWITAYAILVTLLLTNGSWILVSYLKTTLGIVIFCKIASRLAERKFSLPSVMGQSAFFIYAFHGLLITVTQKITIALVKPVSNFLAFVDYTIIFISLYGVSLIAYIVFNRLFPSATKFLCGGR